MDVSIVIVNYKTSDDVINSVKSLRSVSYGFEYEIIVLDNNSCDDSISTLENANLNLKIIVSKENLGTSKAWNLAISQSKGDYVFLLNPDTLFLNNAILPMLDYLKKHTDTAVVCGNLFDLDRRPTHSFRKKPITIKSIKRSSNIIFMLLNRIIKKKADQFNYSKKPIEVWYACAAAVLMNKNMCSKVGFFDESIFMYGEEPVLSFKLRKIGLKTMSIPEPKIIHFEGGSFKEKRKDDFSESRYSRYIKGNRIAFEIIYGSGFGLKYLQALLHNEEKYKKMYIALRKHDKYSVSIKKEKIIMKEIAQLTIL